MWSILYSFHHTSLQLSGVRKEITSNASGASQMFKKTFKDFETQKNSSEENK